MNAMRFFIICFAFWLFLKWKIYRLELEVQLISFSRAFLTFLVFFCGGKQKRKK